MSYTKKIAYSTVAQMFGKATDVALSVVIMAALFRYLGVEGIGKYTTVFAFVAFFAVFADFGLQWTLIRELSIAGGDNPEGVPDKNEVFKNIFTFRLIVALLVHLLAFAAVWFFNYPIEVKLGVGVLTAGWFFLTMNSTLVGVYLNNYRLDISVSAEVIGRVIILLAILLFVKLGFSLTVILSAYLLGNAANFLIDLVMVRKFVEIGFKFNPEYIKRVIRQAVPIGITLVFGFVYYKIDSIMLSVMKGMTDVGIYGTAYKFLEVLQYVPTMFLGAAFPLVTRYAVTKDERVKSAFQKQFDFLMLLALPILGGTYVLASSIIEFIAGSRGEEFIHSSTVVFLHNSLTSVTCLRILVFSIFINFTTALFSYMIVSLGKQKAMIWPTIGFAVLNVVLNLIAIPFFSYAGSSFATLLTEIVVAVTVFYISRRFIILPIRFTNFFKLIFSALAMTVVASVMSQTGLNLFVNIALCAGIYTGLVLALKAIPLEMVREIFKRN